MFDQAGLDYPDENWTEEDYLTAAEQLTIKEGDRVVQYGQLVSTSWGNYFPMIWQHGG